MRKKLGITLLVTSTLGAALAAPAPAATDGLIVTQRGDLRSFGGFDPVGGDPSTTAAAAIFGPGSVISDTDNSCIVSYAAGVTITFADFGAPDISACDPSAGKAQVLVATGSGWATNRGLKLGDPMARLKKLYKERKIGKRGRFELAGKKSPFGLGRQVTLSAVVSGGVVTEFKAFAGAAGE